MNYILEVNAFYNWLEFNQISGNTQALWHLLMSYNNKCAWSANFNIANIRITSSLSISRQELDRIRNVLVQKGLIRYKKGTGNQAGTYSIVSFIKNRVTQTVTVDSTQKLQNTSTLNKQNEIKINNKNIIKKNFTPPTLAEVKVYCNENEIKIDTETFIDFYSSKDWFVGKNKMTNWQASARNWSRYEQNNLKPNNKNVSKSSKFLNFEQHDWDYDKLEKLERSLEYLGLNF